MTKNNLKTFIFVAFLLLFSFPSNVFAAPNVTIDSFSDTPDPFSPNSDGFDDETTISAAISASGFRNNHPLRLIWAITIKDDQGRLVNRFRGRETIKNNQQIDISQVWDGRNRRKDYVENGTYTYQIDARIGGQKADSVIGQITVEGVSGPVEPLLEISEVNDIPDPFSPPDQSTNISANISISGFDKFFPKPKKLPLIWTLVIRDQQNKRPAE